MAEFDTGRWTSENGDSAGTVSGRADVRSAYAAPVQYGKVLSYPQEPHQEETPLYTETSTWEDSHSRYSPPGPRPGQLGHFVEPGPVEGLAPWGGPQLYGPPALPQRVPAEPDVPGVETAPEPIGEEPPAEAPELTRIATYLRDEEAEPPRPDGFDIPAVLAAVRDVRGVREAQLRPNPGGVHTLRLELTDDADPAQVSREVARLLKVEMGLAAEPNDPPPADRDDDRGRGGTVYASQGLGLAPRHGQGPGGGDGQRQRHPDHAVAVDPHRPGEARRHLVPAARRPAEAGRLGAVPVNGGAPSAAATAAAQPRPLPGAQGGPRVRLGQVEVSIQGTEAVVEVQLTADGVPAFGVASGPAFDGYVLRLAAIAAAHAIDDLLGVPDGSSHGRCYVEHAAVMPLGSCEVAVVVLLMVCDGWVEQLAGSAVIGNDPRQAVVHATLAAVNRRLEGLLP